MTADRGRVGAQAKTAEQALNADQRANSENQTAALADDFAGRSNEYDLRNCMVEEFVESKRERTPTRKKAAKKIRTPTERAAAKAAKQVAEMEAAAIAAESAAYETTGSGHAAEQEEDDSAAEPDHARPHPPLTGRSLAPSVSEEHASEESQEEYSDSDGFIYHRENARRHGHRDRDANSPDDRMGEEDNNQPSMFRAAVQTDARNFFKGAHDLTFPSYAPGARWLEETTANTLVQGQVIPKLQLGFTAGQATWILRCGRNQRGHDNAVVDARIRRNSVLATDHSH